MLDIMHTELGCVVMCYSLWQ